MPDVTASYGTLFDFIAFFGYLYSLLLTIHAWIIVSLLNFHWLCVYSVHTYWYVNIIYCILIKYLQIVSLILDYFSVLGYFSVAQCSHYYYNFRKKGPRPKYKYVLDNSKKCLTVGNFGILSVCRSVCL